MEGLFQKSLNEVIDLAASDAPAPGGGSVSAMVACFGLAMTAMVGNLTVGKKNYRDVEPQAREIVLEVNDSLKRLEELAERDTRVFNQFIDSFRLPQKTPEEISAREGAIQKTLCEATETPLAIAREGVKALELTLIMARIGNKTAISDVGVAALALDAAINGALLNVEVNISRLKDREYIEKVVQESKCLSAAASRLKDESVQAARARF